MPEVSIIIPARNEEKFIGRCLKSIISQDYPKGSLEILVIDGFSQDKTREIVEKYKIQATSCKLRLLDNPKKFTPFGLNIGIKNSRGEIIIRMDAHAEYEKDYISKCVKYLKEYRADNVGGAIKTLPSENTATAKSIAAVLSGPMGAASAFRLGSVKTIETDTVFGGCYRKDVFDKVGLFDERMLRSQDIEFNKRLKKSGGKIILAPDIRSVYYPQATLSGFLKHNFLDGFWVTYPLKFKIRYFSLRHLMPLILTSALIVSLMISFSLPGKMIFILIFGPYLFFVILASLRIFLKEGLKCFLVTPSVIFCRHFGYGLGSLWGLIRCAMK